MKLFLKKTNTRSYGTFGESISMSWLCANRNEQGEIISTYWGYLERDAFDPDELEQLIEKNVFKDMEATFLADHYDVVIADGLPTKFDPSDVTVRSRFDGDDEEIITGVSDAIRDYPDYEQTPLLDSIGEQLDEAQHDMFTDDDVRAATAIFEIEQRRDALLLVKHLGWTTGKALLVTKRIEALNK